MQQLDICVNVFRHLFVFTSSIRVCTVVAWMRHKYFDLFFKGNYSDEALFGLSVDITAAQPSIKIKSAHGDTNKHIKIARPESGTYNKHLTGVFEPFSRTVLCNLENNATFITTTLDVKHLQRNSNVAFQLKILTELIILCGTLPSLRFTEVTSYNGNFSTTGLKFCCTRTSNDTLIPAYLQSGLCFNQRCLFVGSASSNFAYGNKKPALLAD